MRVTGGGVIGAGRPHSEFGGGVVSDLEGLRDDDDGSLLEAGE